MLNLPVTWTDEIDKLAEWVLDARALVEKLRAEVAAARHERELLKEVEWNTKEEWLNDKERLKEIRKEYEEKCRVVAAKRDELKQDLRTAEKWLLICEAALISQEPVVRILDDEERRP